MNIGKKEQNKSPKGRPWKRLHPSFPNGNVHYSILYRPWNNQITLSRLSSSHNKNNSQKYWKENFELWDYSCSLAVSDYDPYINCCYKELLSTLEEMKIPFLLLISQLCKSGEGRCDEITVLLQNKTINKWLVNKKLDSGHS